MLRVVLEEFDMATNISLKEANAFHEAYTKMVRDFVAEEKAAGRFPKEFEPEVRCHAMTGEIAVGCDISKLSGLPLEIVKGVVVLHLNDDPSRGKFEFSTHDGLPTLPMKGHGLAWHEGWDIPTRWAIDGADRCWMDNAHGHPLEPISVKDLLNYMADCEGQRQKIRAILQLKPEMPTWMRAALGAGWTPPTDFSRDNYE